MMLAEALMCGVPTIAFDAPGTARQFIKDGISGFVIKTYDTVTFAEKTLDIILKRNNTNISYHNITIHKEIKEMCGIDAVKKQLSLILSHNKG
jgi:glycosyltransferase involved in cell wall biosynthesis